MSGKQNKIAYADCFSGISGNMFLGALIDAGLALDYLEVELAKLPLEKFTLRSSIIREHNLRATRIVVDLPETGTVRSWKDIKAIIEQSGLGNTVKEKSLQVFKRLAEAEASVHGCPEEDVHFHEIGGLDAVVDIVGTAIGIEYFSIDRIVASPLPMPRGWVRCDHGMLPLPAPAVCEILKDVPVYGTGIDMELVTPTGAALIRTLCCGYGNLPAMRISRTGYGAGTHKLPGDYPNLFRIIIGEERKVEETQQVEIIETNIDDWSPEGYPHLCEQLFSAGALDVTLTPVQMKKGRPGFQISVIADPARAWEIKNLLLAETTSIGLRFRREQRMTLPREPGTVITPWGPVMVKRVETPAGIAFYPEYEDCRRVALKYSVPLKDVYAAVNRCSQNDFVKKEK